MIYDENKILTMYQRLVESSKERLELNAIDYFGNKISYEKLIKNMAQILEDIEIDDTDLQQSIINIKNMANELENKEVISEKDN